ncbi:SIMPL domain-containing protein [Candidatus Woesearchaeota archaeon]|nr:SIMPL domain-containing protein [Candidatus Woesearchaeota archaeon]
MMQKKQKISKGPFFGKLRCALALVLVLMVISLAGCAQQEGNTINVDGDAEITVEPDQAEVWAGISIVKDTAEEAQLEANKVMNALIDGLRYKGFSEKDIATERLNLYEERDWSRDEGSKVIGWRASQTVKVKTTDMAKVGTIVDIAVANGANQINNINFGLTEEKEQEYKKQALAEATKNARSKAETIAESLGVKLGKIRSVSEASFQSRPYVYAMAKAEGALAVEEAAVVMPKDVSVTAGITLVYDIG